ncbi:dermonecrotic toxin domain-containing protein [Pseudomonas lini]
MTTSTQPYFFDEAHRGSLAKEPGAREKALNFTRDDLNWLSGVYLPTHAARMAQTRPMQVDHLLLRLSGATDIPLAGAFAMSLPNTSSVMLYTPWKGLIKFADMVSLKNGLKQWLGQATGQRELLRYLSIEQRNTVLATTVSGISTKEIEGAVFQDQERLIQLNQAHNLKAMIDELVKTPILQSMLDETLKTALAGRFPQLDQRLTRLESFTRSGADNIERIHKESSLSLSDALLHYYLTNQWPQGDYRIFSHPGHGISSDADNQYWESAITESAKNLSLSLRNLLETFWNTPMSNEQSRSDFFSRCLCDSYHTVLLLKRQQGDLSSGNYLELITVGEAGINDSLASDKKLRIEKVRVSAPHKHYAELACSLMITSADTLSYLYTPSRGIEGTSDMAAVRHIVLNMMKSEGREDNLLDFMSLEERDTFLSLNENERTIVGEPIVGAVFKQLMKDILAKQLTNLTYALRRYQASEGMLDPHALIDKALDIRGLIDHQLLVADASGRWSTQVDLRWSKQSQQQRNALAATAHTESASEQLTLLSAAEQTLERQLASHPAIPAATRTVVEAQNVVGESLAQLQSGFTRTLSTALRSELQLRTLADTLGAVEQAIIKTVLDAPVRLQRTGLNGFVPDVFALALKAGDATDLLKLASCFVLTERGGLDPTHSGKAILWTPTLGFEALPSLTALLSRLQKRLQNHDERFSLLENLGRVERMSSHTFTLAPLELIHENFLDHVQKKQVRLDADLVEKALHDTLPEATRSSLLNLVSLRHPTTGLHRAMDIAQSLITRQKLPAWLGEASIEDQVLHAELLQQYVHNVNDDKDYLTGIRSLQRTAHHELEKQLKADTFDMDPDNIQVQISQPSASMTSTQTLTDFALIHFHDLEQARFKLVSLDATAIPEGMDESYIKRLIRNLNLGQHQQTVLKAALADTHSNAATRRKSFAAQLPWQLMHYAHAEKLQGRLSQSGFDLIRQVMDMPDAIARAAVQGADAIIRPLQLLGIKSGEAIQVPGTYLIGSKQNITGPRVLIAPYSPEHGVKEYANEQLLLTELKTQGALRNWVLGSLSQADRALCESGLSPASDQPDNVSLGLKPVTGNLLTQLFNDNAALLGRLLGCQSDTNAQSEWAVIKHVLSEDVNQAYTFFMGKLAYPITVWRSYKDIKQSAEDLQAQRWKPAIKSFISGIAQLAMLRQSAEEEPTSTSAISEPAPQATDLPLKWQDVDTTAPERIRLRRHESMDVDLNSMTLSPALGLYTHPTTKKHFAAVEGNVYPVKKRGDRWRIVGDKTQGPYLRQNTARHWIAESDTQRPRYGMLRRLETLITVRYGMNVEADGMPEIRRLYPVKARLIDEGLDQATTYAWNSMRNLQLLKAADGVESPVHQLIQDFIDVPEVLPEHVSLLEKTVGDIFGALLDPTLRQPKSRRFAVGTLFENRDGTYGFVIPSDDKRKIYLAEKFFLPRLDHYRNYLSDASFPISAHARAITLIHELSHIVCNTEDIAYLDSVRPFADLIETSTPRARELKTALSSVQSTALSSRSPSNELFAVLNDDTGLWEDFGQTTYENTHNALVHVLKLTGQTTLSNARSRFMNDSKIRLAVQLGNADSVSWLISHLGRQLHVDTP